MKSDQISSGTIAPAAEKEAQRRGSSTEAWYAIYTRARTEKRLHDRLREHGYDSYLPLIKTLRRWSDRKKWVEVPLLNSYVFVRTHPGLLRDIVQLEGAARYISFEGRPAAIPEKQIDNLRLLVDSEAKIEMTGERLAPGDPVEVTHGSLKGLTGELIKINNRNKVVVRIDKLDINLIIKIQKVFLKKRR
ncbi:MAG: UpxY family transcription antiterminator [bacterium]